MRNDIRTGILAIIVFTVILGLAYPLALTGVGQAVFPNAANGSRVQASGRDVGSRLLGQDFTKPVLGRDGKQKQDADGNPLFAPDPRYFQTRPSVTGNNPAATAFSNLGPNSKDLRDAIAGYADAYVALERPFTPGLRRRNVPNDAVQTSASNVDPHISKRNARIQANRIAKVRAIPLARVRQLITDATDGRSLLLLGEPGVNVLKLNISIDHEARR